MTSMQYRLERLRLLFWLLGDFAYLYCKHAPGALRQRLEGSQKKAKEASDS